jgi:hypothetical protein
MDALGVGFFFQLVLRFGFLATLNPPLDGNDLVSHFEQRLAVLCAFLLDSLRGSSVKLGTIQRRLAWPLRKDDTRKSRSVFILNDKASGWDRKFSNHENQADTDSREGSQKASAELARLASVPPRPVPDLFARGR